MRKLLYIVFVLFSSISCRDDETYFGPVYSENDSIGDLNLSQSILIGCEGNFQYSNASLSLIDLNRGEVQNNLYRNVNGGSIGDVLQSIHLRGDSLFVVLNNSGTIKILNSKTFKEIDSFDDFVSPRYIQFVGNDEFYLTDLYANKLSRFNYRTKQIISEIEVDGWQEEMILTYDKLFIANIEKQRIDILDNVNEVMVDSIKLSFKPTFLEKKNESVIIAAGLNQSDEPFLAEISLVDYTVNELKMPFPLVGIDVYKDELYWCTSNTIQKIDFENNIDVEILSFRLTTPYGFHVHPEEGLFVITDAADYISNGSVILYEQNGSRIGEYEVGIIPQAASFTF